MGCTVRAEERRSAGPYSPAEGDRQVAGEGTAADSPAEDIAEGSHRKPAGLEGDDKPAEEDSPK